MAGEYDVFISHASEDKDSFVRPLAVALQSLGVSVWFDEFPLRPGDSLSRSIDKGISSSEHGLVVVSQNFLQKPWPEYELRGLVNREIEQDSKIIPDLARGLTASGGCVQPHPSRQGRYSYSWFGSDRRRAAGPSR